jgi:hypothetical protein
LGMTVVAHESRCGWQGSTPRIAAPGARVAVPTRRTAASFRQIAAQLHPRRCATQRRGTPARPWPTPSTYVSTCPTVTTTFPLTCPSPT